MDEPQKSIAQARSKVEWAYQHIAKLNSTINEYIRRKPYQLALEHNLQTGAVGLILKMNEAVPAQVSLMIGDSVHNLRAALDYVWTGFHRRYDPQGDAEKVYWPIARDRNDLIGRVGKSSVKVALPNIVSFFADRVCCYENGPGAKVQFRTLNNLDRWDKHRFLAVAVTEINDGKMTITVEGPKLGRNVTHLERNNIYSDKSSNYFQVIGYEITKFHVQQDAEPSFEIVFGQGQPMEHQSVIPVLTDLAQTISDTVKLFETEFP